VRIPIESSTSYRGRNSRPNWLILAASIGAALAAGALAAVFSPRMSAAANHWYAMLAKPAWAPPRSWFGPVWMALYVLMGTSRVADLARTLSPPSKRGADCLRDSASAQCPLGARVFRRRKYRCRTVS